VAAVKPRMFGLSTCGWCAKARAWLDQNYAEYDVTYIDKLEGVERDQAMSYLQGKGLRLSFPILFFGDEAVVGYKPDEYERLKAT
jgi:glutaredoxin-like protein NrdH